MDFSLTSDLKIKVDLISSFKFQVCTTCIINRTQFTEFTEFLTNVWFQRIKLCYLIFSAFSNSIENTLYFDIDGNSIYKILIFCTEK